MKIISYIIVAVISFVLAIFLSSSPDSSTSEVDFSAVEPPVVQTDDSTAYTTYYNQLTDYQKSIYDSLAETISKGGEKIVFNNVNINDFYDNCFTASVAFQYDHPEYFWFKGGYSSESSRESFKEIGKIVFEPEYYGYVTGFYDCDSKAKELDDAVNKVASLAKDHSNDDYERIIFVHDYLIKNAYYDHDALEEYFKSTRSPSCEYIFSAYGCLVNGKTVCSGYAKAFQLIMDRLGYDCIYVTGDAGEAHGWNCIFLEGEGYYIDITWDDYDLDSNAPAYNYCFITSEVLARTHTLDTEYETPVCNATKYNYYLYREYYLEKYSFDAASEIFEKQSGNDTYHIQFASLEELGKAYEDLIEKGKLLDIDGVDKNSKYHYNEDHYTLIVFN